MKLVSVKMNSPKEGSIPRDKKVDIKGFDPVIFSKRKWFQNRFKVNGRACRTLMK